MPKLSDPARAQRHLLRRFRESFLRLTADGCYPPDRQQRLYHACREVNLDWETARRFVAPEALAFLRTMLHRVVADGTLTALEVANLRRLQRRLGLADEFAAPVLDQLYTLIERKVEAVILERAAYLSAPPLIAQLCDELRAYQLPPEREQRLLALLDRQHQLAKLMVGTLPVVRPSVDLYPDEVCHLDMPTTLLLDDTRARVAAPGRVVATSQRLLLLSHVGGVAVPWSEIVTITPGNAMITLTHLHRVALIIGADTQYVATLLAAAQRRYQPTAPSTPARPNKRLI